MKVDIINKSDFELPEYATIGSAGMDLRADLKRYYEGTQPAHIGDHLTMVPFKQYIIPTGIFIALPKGDQDGGYEIQIRPRSGLAAKFGVTILNTPGTIDEDYRGEIKIILICLNSDGYTFKHGERIAQMVFGKFVKVELNSVDTLDVTERGSGGFGHTGLK